MARQRIFALPDSPGDNLTKFLAVDREDLCCTEKLSLCDVLNLILSALSVYYDVTVEPGSRITLAAVPALLLLWKNGVLLAPGPAADYQLAANVVTLRVSPVAQDSFTVLSWSRC